jgi:hypothetical protein
MSGYPYSSNGGGFNNDPVIQQARQFRQMLDRATELQRSGMPAAQAMRQARMEIMGGAGSQGGGGPFGGGGGGGGPFGGGNRPFDGGGPFGGGGHPSAGGDPFGGGGGGGPFGRY